MQMGGLLSGGWGYFFRRAGSHISYSRVIALLLTVLPGAGWSQAQPVNDNCSGAILVDLGTVYSMSTSNATSTGDPVEACGEPLGKTVWFRVPVVRNGILTVSTCGSDFDTAFQAFHGSCENLNLVVCSDDSGPSCGQQASASFIVYSNQAYYVAVGGYAGASGNLMLVASMNPPPNDACSGAIELTEGIPASVNTANATTTSDEPMPSCQRDFSAGVWFCYTPSSNGVVSVGAAGSDLSCAMAVYTGTCGNLKEIGCAYDAVWPPGPQPRIRFVGTAGVRYLILVGGWYGVKAGNVQVVVWQGTAENDTCANALEMQEDVTYITSTVRATSEGDPAFACSVPSGNGVWYIFTPARDGIVKISTVGSDFDTVLQVFERDCRGAEVADGCNNNFGPDSMDFRASVSFRGVAGVPYRILVTGAHGSTGRLQIRATMEDPLINDDCAGALALMDGVAYTQSTALATSEEWYGAKGVWFSYTPATNGTVRMSTCGSDFDTVMTVFSGACGSETQLPWDGGNYGDGPECPGTNASVTFRGVAGTTYLVLVVTQNGVTGNLQIRAKLQPSPPNDECEGAIPLENEQVLSMSTRDATSDGELVNKSIWFTFTPAISEWVTISTVDSEFRAVLAVLEEGCGTSKYLGYGDYVQFAGVAGKTYRIAAGGHETGQLKIVAWVRRPANDDFSIELKPNEPVFCNTIYATSGGDPAPECARNFGRGVWYSFSPISNTSLTIETCGSDFDTALAVYEAGSLELTPVACSRAGSASCGTNGVSVTFAAMANQSYQILAGGRTGAGGNLRLVLSAPPPANDRCEGALALSPGVPLEMDASFLTDSGDAVTECRPTAGYGAWFKFTPPVSGWWSIDTCNSDMGSVLQVYAGDCGSLVSLACGADPLPSCPAHRPRVDFLGAAHTTYRIFLGQESNTLGVLRIVCSKVPPPPNLDPSSAIHMQPAVVYGLHTFEGRGEQSNLPVCQTNFSHAVWYSFSAPIAGLVSISTCDSDFDTVLQVFTGPHWTSLSPIPDGCNDDGGPGCESVRASVQFPGEKDQKYWILVGGYGTNWGNLSITAKVLPKLVIIDERPRWSRLIWPRNAGALQVQTATNLSFPIQWQNAGTGWLSGSNFSLSVGMDKPALFYRFKP